MRTRGNGVHKPFTAKIRSVAYRTVAMGAVAMGAMAMGVMAFALLALWIGREVVGEVARAA